MKKKRTFEKTPSERPQCGHRYGELEYEALRQYAVGGAQARDGMELNPATFFSCGMAVWMCQPEHNGTQLKENGFNAKSESVGQPEDLVSLLANLFEH